MEIEIIESKDVGVICEILSNSQNLHAKFEPGIFKTYNDKQFNRLIDWIVTQEQYTCLLAKSHDQPVGVYVIEVRKYPETGISTERTVLYGFMMAIKEEFQKKGLSKLLIKESIIRANKMNIKELEIDVWCKNEKALSVFKRQGFNNQKITLSLNL